MIREAGIADITQLVEWGNRFHQSSGAPYGYVPDRAAQMAQRLIDDDASVVFMHDHGFIMGTLTPAWPSTEMLAVELAWWANKRGLGLLKSFENWATEQGAFAVCMMHLDTNGDAQRVSEIYGRRGYRKAETTYTKVL